MDGDALALRVGCDCFYVEELRLMSGFSTPALVCTVEERHKESLVRAASDSPESPIYLGTHGFPLFVARCGDVADDGAVTFYSTCFGIA